MAKANLTKQANINVSVREIDFVSRFASNWEALREVLGIARPIKKEAGSKLVAKTAEVTLQSGNVGEGEEIPYSLAQVHEIELGDITIEKYAKAVSIEAVNKYGAEVAVDKTDSAFLTKLQNVVTSKFYTFLATGSCIDYQSTFQSALAMAKGNVLNLWKSMNKDITDIVAFVNVLDFYSYLGSASITVQTAFGMDYVKDFMGYKTVFLMDSTRVPRNKIYATPVENIVCYYVDPSDSDFSKLGLNYTVQGETNLIGFHANGNYNTAVGEMFAIMGMYLFAEYLNGIVVENIGTAPTLTLSIAGDDGTTVLGKNVSDVQSNIAVADNAVTGTSHYITDWTQFSSLESENTGYFLDLKASATSGATVTAFLYGGTATSPVTLDSDMNVVFHLNPNAYAVEFVATKDGASITKRLDISKLIKE